MFISCHDIFKTKAHEVATDDTFLYHNQNARQKKSCFQKITKQKTSNQFVYTITGCDTKIVWYGKSAFSKL